MRAITQEDLAKISPHGVGVTPAYSLSTITVTGQQPPLTTIHVTASAIHPASISQPNPQQGPPPVQGNAPCLAIVWRTMPQLTQDNEVSGSNDPAILHGTVPSNRSGVTVSYGVDLSFYFGSQLAAAGVSSGVIAQLKPFLATTVIVPGSTTTVTRGPYGAAAQTALANNPISPVLSSSDANNLFTYAYGIAESRALNGFEDSTGSLFLALPAAAQSVLTDLAYNFGYFSRWPDDIQQAVANQDWATLATLVQGLGGPRGTNDSAMLQNAIANKVLSSKGPCSAS